VNLSGWHYSLRTVAGDIELTAIILGLAMVVVALIIGTALVIAAGRLRKYESLVVEAFQKHALFLWDNLPLRYTFVQENASIFHPDPGRPTRVLLPI
jgi:hypothetical protein